MGFLLLKNLEHVIDISQCSSFQLYFRHREAHLHFYSILLPQSMFSVLQSLKEMLEGRVSLHSGVIWVTQWGWRKSWNFLVTERPLVEYQGRVFLDCKGPHCVASTKVLHFPSTGVYLPWIPFPKILAKLLAQWKVACLV